MSERTIRVLPDVAALAAEAADRFIAAAQDSIRDREQFSVALSGGSTPKALFQLLASEPHCSRIDWTKVHIYFGDERTVPPDHADSNYRMAREAMLSRLPIPEAQIHRIEGERNPEEAAKDYGQLLKQNFGDDGLDLILLGMGDDGHTASLFPGTKALAETKHRCVANWVEKMNTWRITMSAPFINRAHLIMILVAGGSKTRRLAEVLEGPRDPDRLPIQMIEPLAGELIWMLDAAAAGMEEED